MKTSRILLTSALTLALSTAGLMAKTDAASENGRAHRFEKMSSALNLTPQQQEQAKAIFHSEREAAKPVREQLRQERKEVRAAIESGKPAAEVQQLATREGKALGTMAGMHAAAFSKFYAMLNPDQRQKLNSLHEQWQQHRERRGEQGDGNSETR